MRFAFYTLGCKTNQYETQAMERLLTEMGHELGRFAESLKFLRRALRPYGEGEREVQTEHLHKTLAVHPVADVAHADRIRLGRGQSDEVLNVLYRCQLDLKFHTKSPRKLYKHSYIVYNM